MTKSTVQSQPDVPLVGVAGWFLFLWARLARLPIGVESPVEFRWVGRLRSLGGVVGRGRFSDHRHRNDVREPGAEAAVQ